MHILVAPDKFKGSLTAPEVAEAIASGIRLVFPTAATTLMPLADGGEGTVEALCSGLGCSISQVEVTGPLGAPATARVGRLDDGRCVIEAASAAGLVLVPKGEERAMEASSVGVGQLIEHASRAGAPEVIVGVGGTASTDGGTGAATAIGWRFLDKRGGPLAPGGGALVRLARIDGGEARPVSRVVAACDVTNPLTGANGAAAVFAPQKGAGPGDVKRLEESLNTLAERIRIDLGVEIAELPRAGAGGGLGGGLHSFFRAELAGGFDLVARAVRLDEALKNADLVITGEGRLDGQSLGGKVTAGVARAARGAGVACTAVAGEIALDHAELGDAGVGIAFSLLETVGPARAFSDPRASIAKATADLLRALDI
jgi:glycerate 2-kinase